MPVILATWEAEIRRVVIGSQSRQIVQETLSQKYPTHNRVGGVAPVIGNLPNKGGALSSNPSTAKKRQHFTRYGRTCL
jgi:hypothetical protein